MSEHTEDTVWVVDPNGDRKKLPRTAAELPEIVALGFKTINTVDYGVQRIKHDATDAVTMHAANVMQQMDEASDAAAAAATEALSDGPIKGKPVRKPKAQA